MIFNLKDIERNEIMSEIHKALEEENTGNSLGDFFNCLSVVVDGESIFGRLTPCCDYVVPDGNDCILPVSILKEVRIGEQKWKQ